MINGSISTADARQHLSEILGKVAYGGETFVITKKGRPMAKLVPIAKKNRMKKPASLAEVRGWLADDDPFFKALETIRTESRKEKPRNPFTPRKRRTRS